MATSSKSLQERIVDAYIYNLIHVKTEDLPEGIRPTFEAMKERLTKVEPRGDEGSVMASVREMEDDEAISIAIDIVSMADEVKSDYFDL